MYTLRYPMKKTILLSLSVLSVLFFNPLAAQKTSPLKIIFDSDMGPDFDDVGAIAILHAMAAQGECDIIATMASDGYPYIGPTLEVFNRYFNKPNIPIGVPDSSAPSFSAPNHWNDSLTRMFLPQMKTNKDYPSAVSLYRKVLAAQEDHSVVIVSVGFLSNLAALIRSLPDSYSSLKGRDLVAKKVKQWVAMAGGFPEGNEFNVNRHTAASKYAIEHWPTPILFSGFEIGVKIMTGHKLVAEGNKKSPVQWAYQYCLSNYENKVSANRNSWDHTAVLCAVRNPSKYFYVIDKGTFICNSDGTNSWDPGKNSSHAFLVHKFPYEKIASTIEELMMYEPR